MVTDSPERLGIEKQPIELKYRIGRLIDSGLIPSYLELNDAILLFIFCQNNFVFESDLKIKVVLLSNYL